MRLFVHAVCTTGWGPGEGGKGFHWTKYKLWLLDDLGFPMYLDEEQGVHSNRTTAKGPPPRHPFLPCQGHAWGNLAQK